MILLIVLAGLLLAVILSLALNRFVPTRWLAFGAAGIVVVGMVALVVPPAGQQWLQTDTISWLGADVRLGLAAHALPRLLAALVLAGSALTLATVGVVLPADTRGFGSVVVAQLLGLLGVLLGVLLVDSLLLPLAWVLAGIGPLVGVLVSSTSTERPPIPVGLAGGLMVLAALLGVREPEPVAALVVPGLALALAAAAGLPPLHRGVSDLADAPPVLGVVSLAVGLPFLAMYSAIALLPPILDREPRWSSVAAVLGAASMLIASAGALRATRMRQVLGWLLTVHAGAVLLALGAGGSQGTLAALALLTATTLGMLACGLAVVVYDRCAGGDDPGEDLLAASLPWAGIAFAVGALTLAGLPPVWGFWPRLWLVELLLARAPAALPVVLVASVLALISLVRPVLAFWYVAPQPGSGAGAPLLRPVTQLAVGCAVVLVLLGVVPATSWLPDVVAAPSPVSGLVMPGMVAVLVILVAGVLVVIRRPGARQVVPGDEQRPAQGLLPPAALSEALAPLAALAMPGYAAEVVLDVMLRISQSVQRLGVPFARRYYLAGVLLVLLLVLLIMSQP